MANVLLDMSPADVGRKHRTKTVPPEPDGFMADFDTTFMQQIFHIPER